MGHKDLEAKKEYDRAYYAANREKRKEHGREYRAANKEKIAETGRKWRAANPGKEAEYNREYRAANREKLAERKRKYRAANPEKVALGNARNRARKKGLPFTLKEEDLVFPDTCPCCLQPMSQETDGFFDSPSLDRIVPELGYTKQNVVVICVRCNMFKNAATPEQMYWIADFNVKLRKERGLESYARPRSND